MKLIMTKIQTKMLLFAGLALIVLVPAFATNAFAQQVEPANTESTVKIKTEAKSVNATALVTPAVDIRWG